MWQRIGYIAVNAGHRFSSNHRVNNGFFNRLHRTFKQRVDLVVRELFYAYYLLAVKRAGISGREGNKNISRTIFAPAANFTYAQGNALRYAFKLMREQRCIGSQNYNDRAVALLVMAFGRVYVLRN